MHITIPVLFLVSAMLSSTRSVAQEVRAASDDAASTPSGQPTTTVATGSTRVIFLETFDDDRLLERGWYDGERFEIDAGDVASGSGSIRYHWKSGTSTPHNSSGIRRLIEPSESFYLRCFIRLSKDWKWTQKPYHPHLMHFMTTENSKWHGLITLAHVWRVFAEGAHLATDPVYLLLTMLAAALCGWACILLRQMSRS